MNEIRSAHAAYLRKAEEAARSADRWVAEEDVRRLHIGGAADRDFVALMLTMEAAKALSDMQTAVAIDLLRLAADDLEERLKGGAQTPPTRKEQP